jgi:hypothetical protein
MDLNGIKDIYVKTQARYKSLLPKYRRIYKKYYPDEYETLKKMTDDGTLPQYSYEERNTTKRAYKTFPEDFPGKENWGDLPANFYDPINLRTEDPDFHDKFNYYGWDDFGDRKLPHFEMPESTANFLCMFAGIVEFLHDFEWAVNDCICYHGTIGKPQAFKFTDIDRYIDSRTCHYENEDIIITDPCYVLSNGNRDENGEDDWCKCEYGSKMEALGSFTTDKYATADTIFGDWGCTTYDTDSKEEIGNFCADAGLVSVFSLKQVQEYNPEYNPTERPWCVTLIKNFTGDVTLKVKFDEETCEFVRYVEGKGSVNFIGTQSSL